jgi:hypothetical protein
MQLWVFGGAPNIAGNQLVQQGGRVRQIHSSAIKPPAIR